MSIILVFDCAMLLFPESAGFTKDDNLFTYQAKIISQLGEEGSCVLIGRWPRRNPVFSLAAAPTMC